MKPKKILNIPYRNIDGLTVVLHISENEVHEMNEMGSYIWNLLNGDFSISEITHQVCENFDVSQDQASQDVTSFLDELHSKKLITY